MTATDTIPTSAAELEEMLSDDKRVAALFAPGSDPTKRREFLTNYARVVNGRDASIAQQVREETGKVFMEMMRENGLADLGNRLDHAPSPIDEQGMPKALPKYNLYNPEAIGAKFDKEFKSLGVLAKAVRKGHTPPSELQAKIDTLRNAFSTVAPGDGGYLVPEILRANLLKVALETAVVRPRAMVIPMDSQRVPFPAIDETTHVGSVRGGITSYWAEEGAAVNVSSAKFGRVVLDSKKHMSYAEVPRELVQDSVIAFDAFINQAFPEALAFDEDLKFMVGLGTSEPLGMLGTNNPATVAVAKETGQPATTIVIENLVKAFARMLPSSLGRAVWVASIDTFPQLATMALSVGTGGSAVWLSNGGSAVSGAVAAPPLTIFGRPVYWTEKANTLGSQGDISFVDWSYYLIGDRQAMSIAESDDFKFSSDMIAYKFIQRLDGKPWIKSAITPANGGPTISPIVQLAAR